MFPAAMAVHTMRILGVFENITFTSKSQLFMFLPTLLATEIFPTGHTPEPELLHLYPCKIVILKNSSHITPTTLLILPHDTLTAVVVSLFGDDCRINMFIVFLGNKRFLYNVFH